MNESTFQLMLQSSILVKCVLLALMGFSIGSWAIIFYKAYYFAAAAKESEAFLKALEAQGSVQALAGAASSLRHSPLARMFRAVHGDKARAHHDDTKRLLKRAEIREEELLHVYLPFLATTGATAPFIGLLGTVWGIMNAFRQIGQAGSASLAVVAPGIAEALVTTAAGLAAAIPAVMAYNYYVSLARSMSIQMEDVSEELLSLFSRRAS